MVGILHGFDVSYSALYNSFVFFDVLTVIAIHAVATHRVVDVGAGRGMADCHVSLRIRIYTALIQNIDGSSASEQFRTRAVPHMRSSAVPQFRSSAHEQFRSSAVPHMSSSAVSQFRIF